MLNYYFEVNYTDIKEVWVIHIVLTDEKMLS